MATPDPANPLQLGVTPSQTVGPFLALGLAWPRGPQAVPVGVRGCVVIGGRLLDGDGVPVPDGMVETWQADPDGRFDHPDDPRGAVPRRPGHSLFARCLTGPDGEWAVTTVRPGVVPGPDGTTQAPHLDVSVFARGMLTRVVTRIYLPEDADRAGPGGHVDDPVLATVPAERRPSLIATAVDGGYRFDIRLQGEGETVFFDL
jgi:protocatechuate 3,4-dioxygenase alpha subunit